jgi:hypothetical protein
MTHSSARERDPSQSHASDGQTAIMTEADAASAFDVPGKVSALVKALNKMRLDLNPAVNVAEA